MSNRSPPRKLHFSAPLKVHAGDEAGEFHKRAKLSDAAFKRALLAARRDGREHFAIGTIETPSTAHPVFTPHRALEPIGNTSPAPLCADEGAESDLQQPDDPAAPIGPRTARGI